MMPAPLKKVGLVSVITLLSFMVALFLAEFFIKKLDKYQSRALLDYGDTMRPGGLGPGGYLNENVTLYVTDGLGGKVRWTNNAAGFRNDRDVKQYPPLGVLRILTLGDSFNAGYRVGQEQTFSFLLEQWINRQWGKSEILVSDIEEPTTALYYLNKFGLQFHPHIVLLGITLGNDIVQTYIGMDPKGGYAIGEYNGNASIEKTTGSIGVSTFESYDIPAIDLQPRSFFDVRIDSAERWLNRFHLVRRLFPNDLGIMSWHIDADIPKLFDINNGLGVFLKPAPPMIEEAYQRLFRVIALMQKICQKHQIIFAVQLFPQRFQVQPADWERTVAHYRLKKAGFDLMEPNAKIKQFCAEHNIFLIDPTEAMAQLYAQTHKSMYLPRGDMHWNKDGHRVFYECSQPAYADLVQRGFREVWAVHAQDLLKDKVPSRTSQRP